MPIAQASFFDELLERALKMGRAGDSPAPVGDPPTGMAEACLVKRPVSLARTVTPVPSGGSPVLPSEKFVESRSGAVVCRLGHSGFRSFRLPAPEDPALHSVSTPRSSNRTGPSRASGFRSRHSSCFRPRAVGRRHRESKQSQLAVEVQGSLSDRMGALTPVFSVQPLTQPMSSVVVHRSVGSADRAKAKIIAPAT